METALTLAHQVVVIFLLMGLGIFIRKKGMVSYESARMFSNFVLMVITPMLMVVVFQREKQAQLLLIMGLVALLTVLFHLLAIFVTRFVYPPGGDDRSVIERLLAICSNCGYIGIPLLTAVMGPDGAVYATVYIGVFNFYIWTHGVMTVRKSRSISLREALTSPGIVGVALGVALFLLQLRIPSVALEAMEYVSSMNTPLPTIITGVFIADISLKEALANRRVYVACAMRLLILPLLFLGLVWALRVPSWFPGAQTAALAVLICCACPGAVSTIMLPARFGGDIRYGSNLIAVSNALSVVTIPLLALLAGWVLPA